MEKITQLVLCLFIGQRLLAADTLSVSSNIKNVTVFPTGAEVVREAELTVPVGKTLLQFNNLPYELNPNSIQAKAGNNFEIQSVKHEAISNSGFKKNERIRAFEDRIEDIEETIALNQQKLNVYDVEESVLLDNRMINQTKGVKPDQLKSTADFYRQRLTEIREAKARLNKENKKLLDQINQLNRDINLESSGLNKISSTINIAIESSSGGRIKLQLSYYIKSAGWEPLYDFRYKNLNEPMNLVYQANVYQTSGENWQNVKITLSNSMPNELANVPALNTWYLDRAQYQQVPIVSRQMEFGGAGSIKGKLVDQGNAEPVPFANVVVKQNGVIVSGGQTDNDGNYFIKPLSPGYYEVEASFAGFQPKRVSGVVVKENQITFLDINLRTSAELKEVEVVGYKVPLIDKDGGSSGGTITREDIHRVPGRSMESVSIRGARTSDTFNYMDGAKVRGSVDLEGLVDMTDLSTVPVSVFYEIKIPYTINSDGLDNTIRIKDVDVPARYVHYAVPKVESAAFLTAEIINWQNLNLLKGTASIYCQGTFIGQTQLDLQSTSDTMSLSLGRDPEVMVIRKNLREEYEKRLLGSSIRETFSWEFQVRNNKALAINLVVLDQYPLAVRKSIEVEVIDSKGATINKDSGEACWKLEMKPNERKIQRFKYSVKYPESLSLNR